MNKVINELHNSIKRYRNIYIFFIIITLIGVISGTIFGCILKQDDKLIISDYLNDYFNNINKVNYLYFLKNNILETIFLILIISILGISIIGIPIIILIYFINSFSLGLIIEGFIINFKAKGILYSILYLIIHIPFMIGLILISVYAISISLKLIKNIFKKHENNNRVVSIPYIKFILISFILNIFTNILESFIMPLIFKIITNL